jgi:outer membrane protein TolC
MMRYVCFAIYLLVGLKAHAVTGPLTPDQVLLSAREHYPRVLAALANQDASDGAVKEAQGAFDATIEQNALQRFSGFYDGQQFDTRLVKPVPFMNGQIYGGYRISEGGFPIYEDELFTNENGEVRLGGQLSLLRDSMVDTRRAGLAQAEIRRDIAALELRLTKIAVQSEALRAYWQWVAAGSRVAVLQEMLAIVERRENALKQRVDAGDIAAIYLTENEQAIARRRSQLLLAEQALGQAAQNLSLYYRNADGAAVAPDATQLPAGFPEHQVAFEQETLLRAIAQHPELQRLHQQTLEQEQQLALGENALMPRADIALEVSDDFGAGSVTREDTETTAKLVVSIPLQRYLGEGKRQRAKAEIRRINSEKQLREDELRRELKNVFIALQAAGTNIDITQREITLAKRMEAAERKRFDKGDSDFFLVNMREEASANAAIVHINAQLQYHIAKARLAALTLDENVLKLTD